MTPKALSVRLWVAGFFIGVMVAGMLTAAGVPSWVSGPIGLMATVGIIWLVAVSPDVNLNCPHCGSMLRHSTPVCPKCGRDIKSDR